MSRKHGAKLDQRQKNKVLEKMYHRDACPIKFAITCCKPEFSFRDLMALPFWVIAGSTLWIAQQLGGRWTKEEIMGL